MNIDLQEGIEIDFEIDKYCDVCKDTIEQDSIFISSTIDDALAISFCKSCIMEIYKEFKKRNKVLEAKDGK